MILVKIDDREKGENSKHVPFSGAFIRKISKACHGIG